MLIYNRFDTYEILEILEYYFTNNILLYYLPSYTSYKLQPYNIIVFTLLKVAYYDNVKRIERRGVNTISK